MNPGEVGAFSVGRLVVMAADKPGSVQQGDDSAFAELEESLLSMENLDRSSPELWPEKSMTEFINIFTPPNNNTSKVPYSKEFTPEDQNYLHQLATLPTAGIISKVKELHDMAFQLGVEEAHEVKRGKYLKIFSRGKNRK